MSPMQFQPVTETETENPNPQSEPSPYLDESADASASFELGAEPGAEPEDAVDDPVQDEGKARSGMLDKDGFFELFCGVFAAPNIALVMKGAQPLESLPVRPDDVGARKASDAIYEICEETTWLHWMLAPESAWAQRMVVIGTFGMAKYNAVSAELAARQAPKRRGEPNRPAEDQATVVPMARPAHVDGAQL